MSQKTKFKSDLFQASENYWHNKAKTFSKFYQSTNPFFAATRLFLKQRQDIIVKWIRPDKQGTVLDVGCGGGEFIEFIAKDFLRVVGVDYSELMIELARKNIKAKNVTFQKSDCTNLPIESDSISQLFALGLLDYVKDMGGTIGEFKRVLKKEGTAVLTFPKSPSLFEPLRWSKTFRGALFKIPPVVNILSRADLEALIKSAGLEILAVTSLWTTMWIVHVRKQ